MKKEIINLDTQNLVSIGGGPSPELTNRVIERVALLQLPEIHKRDATPEKPFTINDELNYWEEHQVIFIGRNEQELIEICKVKIKGLERKLIDQNEAIPKPYKRSINAEETIDLNTNNAETLHKAIQEFKAAKEQLLKESQERVVVNKPRISIKKLKPNTFKELFINPEHAELALSVLKEIEPAFVSVDNTWIGTGKGVIKIWIELLKKNAILKPNTNYVTYVEVLNSKIVGLNLTSSEVSTKASKKLMDGIVRSDLIILINKFSKFSNI